jgi:hypothetical protein
VIALVCLQRPEDLYITILYACLLVKRSVLYTTSLNYKLVSLWLNMFLKLDSMFWIQALLSRADLKVKELRQSMDRLKAESEKLEVSLFFCFNELFCST